MPEALFSPRACLKPATVLGNTCGEIGARPGHVSQGEQVCEEREEEEEAVNGESDSTEVCGDVEK
jgi:hypothetical protein